ncbi:unnamed protein product [Cuscuta campestris]|uniref:CCHC-type domain-containing protein n=1 Tax=Cuscuta campestris TaxID=132261 RepID=A0A484N0V9_9ASTE|nr:unnamed protein product [Cuscuta campestris]
MINGFYSKFIRSLTPEWRSKADAIQESIGITNVTIDGLRGNLKTYESTILYPSLGEQKKKGIALKATSSQEPAMEESSDEDNEFGLVIKKFHKFMRKEYERKGKKHVEPPKCYGCGEVGHIKPKCPNAKNEKEKKPFKKHRAYISWGGDSGEESSEGEENESANLCLMAHEEPPEEAYRVFNKRTLTVEESPHVVFAENDARLARKVSCDDLVDSLENIYLNDDDEVDNSKESQDEEVEPLVNEEQPQEEETPIPRAWRTSKNHPLDKVIGDINRKHMAQLMSMFQPMPPPQPQPRIVTFKTLKDNGAEEFRGDKMGEPQIALDWLEQMDRDRFDRAFTKEYVPIRYREERRDEFVALKQEGMSLPELRQKFDYLSQYATSLVSTPEDRLNEFVKKLRPDFRPYAALITTTDFNAAYDLIVKTEKSLDNLQATKKEDRSTKDSRPAASTGPSGKSFGFGGRRCPLSVHGKQFPADLIELPHKEFDIILGMDWLTEHRAVVDCSFRTVRLRAEDSSDVSLSGEEIRTVCDFSDVFPEDLPGLPLPREVEFSINLIPDSLENIYLNDDDEVENSKESQDEEVEPLINEEQPQEEETPIPRAWRTSQNHPLDKVIGDINRKDEDGSLISNVNGVEIYLNEENIQFLTGLCRDGQDLRLYVGEEGARFNETALLEEVGIRNFIPTPQQRRPTIASMSPVFRFIFYILTRILKPRKFNHTTLSQEDTKTIHVMIHNANINWCKFVMTHMFNATFDNQPLPYALLVMAILDEFHIKTDVGPKCKGTKHWEIDESSFHPRTDEATFPQPRPRCQPRATASTAAASTNPFLAKQMAALTTTLSRIDTNVSQTAQNVNILSRELHGKPLMPNSSMTHTLQILTESLPNYPMPKLIKVVNMEVEYWKQKSNIKWLDKGDANSKLFQAYAKGKRKKLSIKHIMTSGGRGTSSPNEIKEETIQHFQNLYTSNHTPSHSTITNLIPNVISMEDNIMLSAIPNMNEVKNVVWELNGDSASGPDGFNGNFFKTSRETIKNDVLIASQEFFLGRPIPCAYGSTYLTLIPKCLNPKRFDDYHPISLSTFMSKINTKILSNRLNILLHKLIPPEQAAFQKGRSIDDHILVAQEAIHINDKKVCGGNTIFKIDMAKAFDKMKWSFIEGILNAFGFSDQSINLLMANLKGTNISILINGEPYGFLKMSRKVKQGDPLSPLLYIITGEGLSRLLNHYADTNHLQRFNVGSVRFPSHLIYADDLMIFTKGDTRNLLKLKNILGEYLQASGQEINFSKSRFYTSRKTHSSQIQNMEKALGNGLDPGLEGVLTLFSFFFPLSPSSFFLLLPSFLVFLLFSPFFCFWKHAKFHSSKPSLF